MGVLLKSIQYPYGVESGSQTGADSIQDQAVIGTEALSPEELNQTRRSAYRSLCFNPRWWMQNIWHVIRHPDDFEPAAMYALKITDNYLFHRMRHAH